MSALDWPLPAKGETASFSHLRRTRQHVDLHSHRDHQLVLPIRGTVAFRIGAQRVRIDEPRALFFWPDVAHALEAPSGAVDLFAVQASAEAMRAAAEELGVPWERPPEGYAPLSRVTPLLRELVHQLSFHAQALAAGNASAAAKFAYPFFCLTLAERLSKEEAAAPIATFRSEYVERAVTHLRAHVEGPLALPELARQVGTSPRNLSREFQRELGTSPVRFASKLRLEEAARRLWASDAPVKDIALSLGFVSVPRFNSAFRALKGCTPLEHRGRRP